MSGSKRISTIALLLVLVMAVLACGLPTTGGQPIINLPGSGETLTMEAISTGAYNTAMAIFTQNAILTPSATQGPTDTPEPTEGPTFTARPSSTATATMYVLPTWTRTKKPIATRTPTSSGGGGTTPSPYSCAVVDQSPTDGLVMSPGNDFDIHWFVKNTGTKDWLSANVDTRYLSGKDFAKNDVYDLTQDVKVGQTYDVFIDAIAPLSSGIYTMYWSVVEGSTVYCKFYLSIKVK